MTHQILNRPTLLFRILQFFLQRFASKIENIFYATTLIEHFDVVFVSLV